ncbi:MAG: branched-chain amino acid ABC transporter permease [Patescibacteria group bacterium]
MEYILHLAIVVTIFSILAMSLNYVAGYTGILSLSHATFYGIGAYATAILTTQHGFSFVPSVMVGMVLAAVIAYLASFPILKLKEDSLVLVSFGFSIIMFNVMLNWTDLTKGPLGIKGIAAPEIFGLSFFSKPLFFCFSVPDGYRYLFLFQADYKITLWNHY